MASARAIATRCFCPPERRGVLVALGEQPHFVEQRLPDARRLFAGAVLDRDRGFGHVLERGQMGEQVEILKDHSRAQSNVAHGIPEFARHVPVLSANADSVDGDLARGGFFQTVEAAQQGGFARSAAPDDHDHFARVHVERDVAQHMQPPEELMQIADVNNGFAHRSPRAMRRSRRSWKAEKTMVSIQ